MTLNNLRLKVIFIPRKISVIIYYLAESGLLFLSGRTIIGMDRILLFGNNLYFENVEGNVL